MGTYTRKGFVTISDRELTEVPEGKAESRLPQGEPAVTLMANPRYLVEALSAFPDSDLVEMRVWGPVSPVVFQSQETLAAVMPILLDEEKGE